MFDEIRNELDALADARGINKAVLIVDIAQKLSAIERDVNAMQKRLDELKTIDEAPDGEIIAGKRYTYGEVAK